MLLAIVGGFKACERVRFILWRQTLPLPGAEKLQSAVCRASRKQAPTDIVISMCSHIKTYKRPQISDLSFHLKKKQEGVVEANILS